MHFTASSILSAVVLTASSLVSAQQHADPSIAASASSTPDVISCSDPHYDASSGLSCTSMTDNINAAIANVTSAVKDFKDKIQLAAGYVPGTSENQVLRLDENADYILKPLDAVLFAGSDPVANFIKKVELHEVVPRLGQPFHELWTHAGILIDKTVLPLPFLEEGKMYLYESVFSGQVAGYVYSKVLPVDHKVEPGSFHLGPQIRDFAAVVAEGDSDVGIAPLSPDQRAVLEEKLKENPNLILDLYNEYHDFGYPITNILPVLASASQNLYKDLQYYNEISKEYFHTVEKKSTVFCSELVSIIYKNVGFPTFAGASPDTFTPLAVEVAPEFGNVIYYAKEDKIQRLEEPHDKITTMKHITKSEKTVSAYQIHQHWVPMPASGGIPPNAVAVGYDTDNAPLYVARAKIGKGYHVGKIRATAVNKDGSSTNATIPSVTYFDREIPVNFGHEVLTSLEGMQFVDVADLGKDGDDVFERCLPVGLEDDGVTSLYLARAVVGQSSGFFGFGAKKGALVPGVIASNLKEARIGFEGEELKVNKFQVLCQA